MKQQYTFVPCRIVHMLKTQKNSQRDFKTAKNRVRLLLTCNMNWDKEEMLLIGKSTVGYPDA